MDNIKFEDLFIETHQYCCQSDEIEKNKDGSFKLTNGVEFKPDEIKYNCDYYRKVWVFPLQRTNDGTYVDQDGRVFPEDDHIRANRICYMSSKEDSYIGSYKKRGLYLNTNLPLDTVQELIDYFRSIDLPD